MFALTVTNLLLAALLILNIALGFSIIFLERKDASATWAWLMVLLFIPVIGFIVYLIFGRRLSKRRIFTYDTKSKHGIKKAVHAQKRKLENNTFAFNNPELKEHIDLYYMHLRNNDALFTQDNEVRVYTDGHEKFETLIRDLAQAKDHIHLQYYIIRYDRLGQRITNTLIKKAQEGVDVRVLYDDLGSRLLSRKFIKRLRMAGANVDAFFPSKIPKLNLKINYRNHRKLTIIDGKIGYIGGFNIGDEYVGENKKFGYWRDTHLRMRGDAVRNMQTRFILDWNQASRNHITYQDRFYDTKPGGDTGVQIVSSGPDSEWEQIKYGYIKMILEAKEYVYIQTPYYIPDESLRDALRIAVLSGVKIKLMIPNQPDHPFVYWATMSYVGDLLNAGAEVFIYQGGFLHAKTIVVDGKLASVGTANIDVRSFRLNFEVNAFLYDRILAAMLLEAFEEDIQISTQMTKTLYKQRSLMIRFKESISRLLSPIL